MSVSVLGAVLALAGCIGWFREVLPHEHEEVVPVVPEDIRITTDRRIVELLPIGHHMRAWLPVKTYPVSAGVKGGLAGGVAMAVLACTYGLLKAGSIWYPINLLAAVVYAESLKLGPCTAVFISCGQLRDCSGSAHLVSALVGLLYGAMLPMFARRPIVLGGLHRPCSMVGAALHNLGPGQSVAREPHRLALVYCFSGGLRNCGGSVVVRESRMPTHENLSFAIRAGIEAPGTIPPRENGEELTVKRSLLSVCVRDAEPAALGV